MPFSQDEFLQQVGDALKHLYDYPYLQEHPLALQYWPDPRRAKPSRAHKLSRLLLENLEALHPPDDSYKDTSRAQYYALLVYRYVEEWPLEDIMHELSYSRRQFYREQRKAIAMLAALLWEQLPLSARTPAAAAAASSGAEVTESLDESTAAPLANPSDLLDAEIERFLGQREPVDVAEIVQGALQVVAGLAKEHGVALSWDVSPRLPSIYTSRTLIRQVLLRALSDLITRPGTRQVRLTAHPSNQRVMVELTAEPRRPSQRDRSEDHGDGGIGYVQHLVEMMGGNWQGIEAGPASCTCRFDFAAHAPKVLLVIEDNEAVIKAFRRYLAGYDYQVIGATAGDQAIQLARDVGPAAITLDVMMPTLDGWEVLQRLQGDAATRHIPVIICSVLRDAELARSLGAAAYLRKPVTQSDLLAALESLVAARQERSPR